MHINYSVNHFKEDIRRLDPPTVSSFFDINMYGVTMPNPNYELYLNPHGYHVFEYVVSGSGYIDYGDEHIKVSAGDFYYLKRGFIGHYYSDGNEPYEKIWINATGTMIDDFCKMFNINSYVLVVHGAKVFEDVIRRIHQKLDMCENDEYTSLMRSCAVDIFELMSLARADEVIESTKVSRTAIEGIKQYIRGHIFEKLDLDALAEHYHLNPSYLVRKFKKETGVTPIHYYNLCRIDAARSMLVNWQRPVKVIAAALKYVDASYFSGCFKAATGYSPSEYTQELHEEYLSHIHEE